MSNRGNERKRLDEAKRLLRAKLARHPDQAVRWLALIGRLSDDDPAVQRIARALGEKK